MARRSSIRRPKPSAGHGHPTPQLAARLLDLPERLLGLRDRPRGAAGRRPSEVRVERHDPGALRAGDGRRAASATPASTAAAGTAATFEAPRAAATASGCCSTSAPSTTRRTVWVNGALVARHEGGYTPVLRRHHRPAAPTAAADDRRARRRRSARPRQAARQAGLAARAALASGTRAPPASGRRSGSRACRATWIGSAALDAEPGALGDRLRGRGSAASRRERPAPAASSCAPTSSCSPTTPTRVVAGEVHRRIALSDPGIDDFRNELLWSPDDADAHRRRSSSCWADARRAARRGRQLHRAALDRASRATGSCSTAAPTTLRMVLDQGYWPETGLTRARRRRAAARRRARQGDGLQRRAQAPEDRGPALSSTGPTGSACWSGRRCPAPTASRKRSIERLTREWTEAIARDCSHPCIVAWVPFNESWGVPNLPDSPARAPLRAGALPPDQDPRPDPAGDRQRRLGERRHRHHRHPRLRRRPRADRRAATTPSDVLPRLFKQRAPRRAAAGPRGAPRTRAMPVMLTEFGGIAARRRRRGPGATRARRAATSSPSATASCSTRRALARAASPASATPSSPTPTRRPTGCCYADRTPKFPLEEMAAATRGVAAPRRPNRTAAGIGGAGTRHDPQRAG